MRAIYYIICIILNRKMEWVKTVNQKDNIWFEYLNIAKVKKNNHLSEYFITLQKQGDYIRKTFKNSNWEVRAGNKININTEFGKSLNFKYKKDALKFINEYLKNTPNKIEK